MVSQDSKNSESSWDPTAGILYDGWNFSASRAGIKDSADIAALLDNVGMPKFILSDTLIRKEKAGLKINLLDYGQTLTLAQVALFLAYPSKRCQRATRTLEIQNATPG
jgi:hypothetical protein